MVLVEHEGDQVGAEVSAFDRQHPRGKGRQHRATLGQVIAAAQIACRVALDDKVLHHICFKALERGPLGKVVGMQRHLAVNVQFRRLGPLGRIAAALLLALGLGRRFQQTGLDVGTGR